MKRLTILPDKMTDDTKNIMIKHYGGSIKELDSKTANEILVRSSPKDFKHRQLTGQISKDISPSNSIVRPNKAEPPPIQKYCQYPPTGSSSVSVTTEDYYCLEEESFCVNYFMLLMSAYVLLLFQQPVREPLTLEQ